MKILSDEKNQDKRDNLFRVQIGSRLKLSRERAGLTGQNAADECGVSPTSVNSWENGAYFPQPENLICLRKLYGVSLDWLMGIREQEKDADKLTVMEAWEVAPVFGKESLLSTARLILGQGSPPA